jgi:hypothetical protein
MRFQWWQWVDRMTCAVLGHSWIGGGSDPEIDPAFEICVQCGIFEEKDYDLMAELTS